MPEGFETVPDWFSDENQGAGIAVADLGGQQHLVILMVDNPLQQNRGLYRIGRTLDGAGHVTGGWTPWMDVPDWFSWENQGADVAVADLGGDGGRDLVVFMIDNPPQQNRGLYRIGRNLDSNGNVSAWTPWIDIPDWFSWENQGGGIAVTPPDAQGRRNLVVFMIDNSPQQNRGFYRVGNTLDANGNVTGGWTPWAEVPDWFSRNNQGGSAAIADLDGDGSQDLVVFMIDNVIQAGLGSGENQGYYKFGRKLGVNGQVARWDDNWSSLPYWFTWENQGGGIDVAMLEGRKRLFTLLVDNPPGKNDGLYQVVDLDFDPAAVGRWDRPFTFNNVAIHVSVLPNGKVLFWGRTDDDPAKGENRDLNPHVCTPWVWDPVSGEEKNTNPDHPRLQNGDTVNLFCGGHAFMPDGRLFVAGGHLNDGDGSPQASTYNYVTNTWESLPQMDTGRWYPTVTALPDGRMLVSAGSFIKNNVTIHNTVSQIWDGHEWRRVAAFPEKMLPLYPRLHIAPDGQIFMSGSNAQTYFLDLAKNAWEPDGTRKNKERQYAPSVMYDIGKVIYLGGGSDNELVTPTANAEIIDLGVNPLAWQDTARMHFRRRQHNATLLPDGTILALGGTRGDGFNNLNPGKPVHAAELWDPQTKQWTLLAAEDIDRGYHCTAVLLPDATVLSAGSGEFFDDSGKPNNPKDTHRQAQIFHPPYLFRGPRPQITDAPAEVGYGAEFSLKVSGPEIGHVNWIRLPSVTHAFDQNQRINFLEFRTGTGGLTVTAPARPELCPPGHYMLFVLSKDGGVPSEAQIIRIGLSSPQRHPALTAALAAAEAQHSREEKTPIEIEDEIVRQSTGTRVTLGLTARCPYGLGACWAGAYEALTKLSGVEAVRPVANTETATADLYLRNQGLPDLDRWPQEFAQWANRSYDFRGVEVRLTGTVQEHDGELELTATALASPVQLLRFQQGMKIQWDFAARKAQDATPDELQAYDNLRQEFQSGAGLQQPVSVIGPLTTTAARWSLYVREFER